jgi:hypothetical protein
MIIIPPNMVLKDDLSTIAPNENLVSPLINPEPIEAAQVSNDSLISGCPTLSEPYALKL